MSNPKKEFQNGAANSAGKVIGQVVATTAVVGIIGFCLGGPVGALGAVKLLALGAVGANTNNAS